jgi:hypothetical protein
MHGSRPACASLQPDQFPCCSLTNPVTGRETDSEQQLDPDQTARMRRLGWIHAGRWFCHDAAQIKPKRNILNIELLTIHTLYEILCIISSK